MGVSLDRYDLVEKLQLSARAMRYRPVNAVVVRRAILLALAGRAEEAGQLMDRLARTPPAAKQAAVAVLRMAEGADPAAIRPLIARIGPGEQSRSQIE